MLQEYFRNGSGDGGPHSHTLVGLVSLALEGEIILTEDDLEKRDNLLGSLYVIIF